MYRINNLHGTYVGSESGNIIQLNNDSQFIVLHPEGSLWHELHEIDTLSYGRWEIEDNLVSITSSPDIGEQALAITITESFSGNKDSVYFYITNPYEKYYTGSQRLFQYVLDARGTGEIIENLNSNFYGNKFVALKKDSERIDDFSIIIVPDVLHYPSNVAYNYLFTPTYEIRDKNNNTFEINIPHFTYKYLSYSKFVSEYLKILDKNNLSWKGEVYSKKQ